MRQMMLNVFDGAAKRPARQSRELIGYPGDFSAVAQTRGKQMRAGSPRQNIAKLAPKICARIAVNRDMGQIAEICAGLLEAISDRGGGKAGPMFDASKPLFLGCRQQRAVAHNAGGSIGMV